MNNEKKLKPYPTGSRIFLFLSALFVATYIFLIIRSFYGVNAVFLIGALAPFYMAVWGAFLLLRTKNEYFLFLVLMGIFFVTANLLRVFYSESIAEYFLFCTLLLFAIVIYIFFTRKIKFRGREILELAAKPINETANGFTARPYVAGKAEYSPTEIKGFSKFLLKHLIALPYYEESRIVFQVEFSLWNLSKLSDNYSKTTYVTFEKSGDIVVFISNKYYSKYKDELTFDKLCASLAALFKEFLELYKQGAERKIINRMDALKESVLS